VTLAFSLFDLRYLPQNYQYPKVAPELARLLYADCLFLSVGQFANNHQPLLFLLTYF
jgi:hypothetical protein